MHVFFTAAGACQSKRKNTINIIAIAKYTQNTLHEPIKHWLLIIIYHILDQ